MMSQQRPQKRYGLFIWAIFLLLLGGVAMFLGLHNFAIRGVGAVCLIVSVYLVRISNFHTRPTLLDAAHRETGAIAADANTTTERPGRPILRVGVALLLLLGGSSLYLYLDALHGYREVLPVFLFAGVALACALVWSYILTLRIR